MHVHVEDYNGQVNVPGTFGSVAEAVEVATAEACELWQNQSVNDEVMIVVKNARGVIHAERKNVAVGFWKPWQHWLTEVGVA